MPPIEVVKGSEYNIAPDARENQMDDFLQKRLKMEGKTVGDLETEIITCPFVQVPVNVMEDRLFGSVDVKKVRVARLDKRTLLYDLMYALSRL
jgi:magnesium chelatase subunit D